MQNIQKAKVTWVESYGFAPGGGLAYKVWFTTTKTKEEGVDFVFSNKAVRLEDHIYVEKQKDGWREVTEDFINQFVP